MRCQLGDQGGELTDSCMDYDDSFPKATTAVIFGLYPRTGPRESKIALSVMGNTTRTSRASGRIAELTTIIQARGEEIEKYLSKKGLTYPSFDGDTSEDLPQELHAAQHALLEASDELTALVQGPRELLSTFAKEVRPNNLKKTKVRIEILTHS